jgi:hypothetical protein
MQRLQPVHINDIVESVGNWLADETAENLCINATGSQVVSMREMLDSYRTQMGHGPALHITVPGLFVKLGAWLGDFMPFSPLTTDTLTMLNAGNTGDYSGFAKLLGREPLSVDEFIQKSA